MHNELRVLKALTTAIEAANDTRIAAQDAYDAIAIAYKGDADDITGAYVHCSESYADAYAAARGCKDTAAAAKASVSANLAALKAQNALAHALAAAKTCISNQE